MKAIGDECAFYYRLHYGDPPKADDVLVTRTGRHYLVRRVTMGKTRLRVHCVIVPPNVETPGRRFTLVWDKRGRTHG